MMDMSMAQLIVIISWVYAYHQTHQVVYVKHVQLFACQSCLCKAFFVFCAFFKYERSNGYQIQWFGVLGLLLKVQSPIPAFIIHKDSILWTGM